MMTQIRSKLVMLALAGWFFIARGETNDPGVILTQEFEGFKTKALCEKSRARYEDFLAEMGAAGVKVSAQCEEKVRS